MSTSPERTTPTYSETGESGLQAQTEQANNTILLQHARARAFALLERDMQLQQSQHDVDAGNVMLRECSSTVQFLAKACELYAERPALSRRETRRIDNGLEKSRIEAQPRFMALTYKTLWERIVACAAGLSACGWVKRGDFVGICGFTGIDYVIAQYACFYLGAVVAPLPTVISIDDLRKIVNEAEISTIITDIERAGSVSALLNSCTSIRRLLLIGNPSGAQDSSDTILEVGKCCGGRIEVEDLASIELTGAELPRPAYVVPDLGEDPLRMLLYTSGSTGLPKGVMFTERMLVGYWHKAIIELRGSSPNETSPMPQVDIGISFMPQNHLMGQLNVLESFARGGSLHFTLMSDMSTLLEDIRLVRPTSLTLVPRVAEMIYQFYQNELARRAGDAERTQAMRSALEREMRHGFLGNRLFFMRTGTAPTAGEIAAFLKRIFQVPVYDMYGSTEAVYVSFEDRITTSTVAAYKLVDVTELGYRTTDQPFPRGELRLKMIRTTPGYFKNPDATKALIDQDGFICTGDVFEQLAPDHFVWVDRRNNILKLAQGEFVSLWRLESLYAGDSRYISQIYLHADSLYSHVLAVIVPDREALAALPDPASLRQLLAAELHSVARKHHLQAYEIPRDFLIDFEPFSLRNGLLTESGKSARQKLKAVYGARLYEIYARVQDVRRQELAQVRAGCGLALSQQIEGALRATLGAVTLEAGLPSSFRELGGDSMAAVELGVLLEELTGVRVPLGLILNPVGNLLLDLVNYIEQEKSRSAHDRVGFSTIHGADVARIHAHQLRLEVFLGEQEHIAAQRLPAFDTRAPRTLLLTGAGGFLGRFLVAELLEQLPADGRLYCLVRARSDAAALQRLREALAGVALREKFDTVTKQRRLVVVAGDLMRPHLGLEAATWQNLAHEVESIFHNGAMVNHALSYAQLFEPNVLGTMEIARLALSEKRKSICFVSSAALGNQLQREKPIQESEDALALYQACSTDIGYAAGYAASKWAGEVLLRRLCDEFDVPVQVFRCGMLLAHSRQAKEINADDMFSRLLFSLAVTGLAPGSFYVESDSPGRFHGLPVDFVARTLTAIALRPQPGCTFYHVLNRHEDGVSLDLVVDWMIEAGFAIKRIEDYAQWHVAFSRKLAKLPAEARSRSVLPILQQWQRPATPSLETRFEVDAFAARVATLAQETGMGTSLPTIGRDFIHKCLDDLCLENATRVVEA